jgi:hypothetical protein
MPQYYTINDARNPRWANPEHNAIDLEVDFTDLPEEYLPYTASPTDVVEHSRELYNRALAGEFGTVAEYDGPLKWTPINKTTIEVSTEGLVQLLLEKGILTDEEVDAILVEETVTVGFARTTIDGSSPIYNGVY